MVALLTEPIPRPYPVEALPQCGALAEFYGIVRGEEAGEPIRALCYEAYEPMARQMLKALAQELATKHGCHKVYVVHRLGEVPVGEAAIYLAALSPHRKAAFALLSDFMDRLKADIPIWKTRALPL